MDESEALPEAPEGLGRSGTELWNSVVKDYELNGAGLRILFDAATEADIIDELHSSWVAEGMPKTAQGSRFNIVAHPTVSELRQHKTALRGLLGSLRLPPLDDDTEPVRSKTRSEVGRMGSSARWDPIYGIR